MEWDVKEMKISNAPKDSSGVWRLEYMIPEREKIETIDKHTEGEMSRLLGVINSFDKEKDLLKKDRRGDVKTVSLNAWLRRHPCGSITDGGEINILGMRRSFQLHGCRMTYDHHAGLVDEVFHRLLVKLAKEERVYFDRNDERTVLCKRFEKHPLAGFFESELRLVISSRDGIITEDGKPLTVPQLRYLISKADEAEKELDTLVAEACAGFAAAAGQPNG